MISKDDLFIISVGVNVLLTFALVQLYENIKYNKDKK